VTQRRRRGIGGGTVTEVPVAVGNLEPLELSVKVTDSGGVPETGGQCVTI
jgi:hypothetical protein